MPEWRPGANDAEQAVVGCLLADSEAIAKVAHFLLPEHFDLPAFRVIYDAALELHRQERAFDSLVLQDHLQQARRWNETYQAEMQVAEASVLSATAIVEYARIVRRNGVLRRATYLARDLETEARRSNEIDAVVPVFERMGDLLRSPGTEPDRFAFRGIDDLRGTEEKTIPWVCSGLLAKGYLTLLVSKPKGGKSTLAFGMLSTLEAGTPFLGLPTVETTAVYLSEEDAGTILQKAARFGLRRATFLTRRDAYPRVHFREVVKAATAHAHCIGAGVLVIDTLTFWAGLPPDAEKDAGAMQAAADVLLEAAATGLAVVLIHHSRKAPGDESDIVRGSSALPAAADIVATLARTPGEDRSLRTLRVMGRDEACPPEMVIRLTERGYERVGTEEQVKALNLRDAILDLLPEEPEEGLTTPEVRKATKARKEFVVKVLKDLVEEGIAGTTGTGKSGSPIRYRRFAPKVRSGSRPHRDGTGTDTNGPTGEDESDGEDPPIVSVPVPTLYRGTGTDWASLLPPVPWLGYSSDLWPLWNDLWSRWQERACVLEAGGGLARVDAERRAWQEIAP